MYEIYKNDGLNAAGLCNPTLSDWKFKKFSLMHMNGLVHKLGLGKFFEIFRNQPQSGNDLSLWDKKIGKQSII